MRAADRCWYRVTSLTRNSPFSRTTIAPLGIFLLEGPRGALFLMSKAPLHPGVDFRVNLRSISHRCHCVSKLTKAAINLPLSCLQGGY